MYWKRKLSPFPLSFWYTSFCLYSRFPMKFLFSKRVFGQIRFFIATFTTNGTFILFLERCRFVAPSSLSFPFRNHNSYYSLIVMQSEVIGLNTIFPENYTVLFSYHSWSCIIVSYPRNKVLDFSFFITSLL